MKLPVRAVEELEMKGSTGAGAALVTPLVLPCMPGPARAVLLEAVMKYGVKKEAQKRRE